jgi:starch-binding outer membrane protein, SusD/RagB family
MFKKAFMKKIFYFIIPAVLIAAAPGCKKSYLDTAPSNAVTPEVIFNTTDGAYVALDGTYRSMYTSLTNHGNFGQKSYDIVNDLMGNDMVVHSAGYGWFNTDYRYTAQASAVNDSRSERLWWYYYRTINNANNILAKIDAASGPQADKDNIKGQALTIRAYAYYNLINYFQHTYKGNETKPGVPLITAPSTVSKGRGTVQEVYTQIVKDLTDAEPLLTGKTRIHMSHINVNVAQGFRARVALQMEDYATAATYANKARQGRSPMSTAQYKAGFSKITDGNPEWMWGMEVITDQSTIYASFYSHMDITTGGYANLGGQKKITKDLYDQIPAGDVRKEVFTTPGSGTCSAASPNPNYNQVKFHVPTPGSWAADYIFMRAAEMYLIEAEALARQGQDASARTVLETLIKARNPAYSAASFAGTALVNEILLQRRIELWGEGFAYFDIKRLKQGLNRPSGAGNHGGSNTMTGSCAGNNYDPILYTLAPEDPRFLMKIPQKEIDANEFISPADQNP